MYALPLALLSLLSVAFASPFLLARHELGGSCKSQRLMTEENFHWGARSFCANFNPTPEDPNPTKKVSTKDTEAFIFTLKMPSYDGKTLDWVYRIKVRTAPHVKQYFSTTVNYNSCMTQMRDLLNEGRLGKEYCVVDGTETVLFQGGLRRMEFSPNGDFYGYLAFESYLKGSRLEPTDITFGGLVEFEETQEIPENQENQE